MEKEIWKDIKDYEGLYQISNLGRIKSVQRMAKSNNNNYRIVHEKFLKQLYDKNGYNIVSLNKNNRSKLYRVHRLVAEAFIPNEKNYPCVNHIDENKANNNVKNLEWCTVLYNNVYRNRTKKVKEKLKIPIKQCDLNGNIIKQWSSATDVHNILGYDISLIRKCCKNKRISAYGYKWISI